ncbi:MAG: sulfatase-like hydrolase/transferase [Planctomycetota bacterium]
MLVPSGGLPLRPSFFLLTFLIVFVVGIRKVSSEDSDIQRPNILFILADDVGQEVLECYGGQSYATPNLNELARTGMKFNHAFSMPVCHPTRITLMTGKYPFRHGQVRWGDFPKSEESTTWSSLLAANGYATHIAGKWQLCLLGDDPNHPRRLGFEHWDLFGWHEGPRFYEPMIYHDGAVRDDTLGHYGPDLYVRSVIEFMKAAKEQAHPFIAYYSMAACHEVTDDLPKPVPHGPFGRYDSYAEMVAEMDRNVGRLVSALDALGLRENTIVIFTADNGTPQELIVRAEGLKLIKEPVVSMQDGRLVPGGKKKLTDDGTNVPLIANWPGKIRPGQVVDDLVDMSDYLPTFAELAGAPMEKGRAIDGHSFAPRLLGAGSTTRRWAYAEEAVLPKPGGTEPDGTSSGSRWVRTDRWKLYNDGRLLNLVEDNQERYPLTPADPHTSEAMSARKQLVEAFAEMD